MEAVIQTVEIPEPETVVEAVAPTREELKGKGWSASELESAEKHGMLGKPEEKKPVVLEEVKEEVKAEVKEEVKSSLPDFEIKDPAKEKVFLETFGAGTPQRAMYFRMKNERQARQRAETERESARKEAEDLKARLAAYESKKEIDEDGNEVDPDDKPLTVKQWRELQKQEAIEIEKKQAEQHERAQRVTEAQTVQEEYARSVLKEQGLPDFDDTVKLATDLMQNLEAIIPEKWKQVKAIKLFRELQSAAANADKYEVDDYNPAMIAYEIGQLHPDYGKKADTDGKSKDPKANGGLTPEQMKRIEENTQRRASSASIPGGGGRRVVSADDVTLADLNKMNQDQLIKFRKDHPERYDKLRRG